MKKSWEKVAFPLSQGALSHCHCHDRHWTLSWQKIHFLLRSARLLKNLFFIPNNLWSTIHSFTNQRTTRPYQSGYSAIHLLITINHKLLFRLIFFVNWETHQSPEIAKVLKWYRPGLDQNTLYSMQINKKKYFNYFDSLTIYSLYCFFLFILFTN